MCATTTECSKELKEYYGYVPIIWRQPDFDDPRPFPAPDTGPAAPAVAPRVVTAAEVERFLPVQGVVHSEPRGWAVVGVWANFWVEVAPVTVDGELLGASVQVRFTPTRYVWDYGDGEVVQTDGPGGSWAVLGQEELTRTPTGHVYAQRGKVTVSVRVGYAAQYRVGGGDWVAVQGEVVAPAPSVPMLLVTESTVLIPTL